MVTTTAAPHPDTTDLSPASERRGGIEFIDLEFTDLTAQQVLHQVRIRDPDAPFAFIVTPNVDHVVRLQRSEADLRQVYRDAWITLCDSRVLAGLARWTSGLSLPVLPGSDLTARMLAEVVEPHDRVAIVGGEGDAVAQLAQRYGLRDVRHFNPPHGFIGDPAELAQAVTFVVASRARYAFLAVGSPQQEMLAHRIERTGHATGIGLCVGASLDFLTGRQKRAPAWMQRVGLEWLYRLATQPRRLARRYLIDGPAIFWMARRWHARAQ